MSPSPGERIAVAVVEHQGHYLIGRRPAGVPLAGLWEFPGGKVHPGETAQQAAQRECLEETGLEVEAADSGERVLHDYEHGLLLIDFLPCRISGAKGLSVADLPPHAPFCWVKAADLRQYDFPPANAGLVQRLGG